MQQLSEHQTGPGRSLKIIAHTVLSWQGGSFSFLSIRFVSKTLVYIRYLITYSAGSWSRTRNPPMPSTWWRHDIETLSPLLTLCEGMLRSPVDSPHKGPVVQSFGFFLVFILGKLLKKAVLPIIWHTWCSCDVTNCDFLRGVCWDYTLTENNITRNRRHASQIIIT